MSSKSGHDHYSKHRSHHRRSRSRSPSHRSEKRAREHDKHSSRRDDFIPPRVKSEPADKGYRKYEHRGPGRAEEDGGRNVRQDDRRQRDRQNERGHDHQQVRVKQERERNDDRRREHRRQRGDENPFQTSGGNAQQGAEGEENPGDEPPVDKEGPNFGLSGALTEDTNTFRGIVIKYNEPAEARKPKMRWRLYVFKGEQEMPTLFIHRQSAYLLGRERLIADIPIDHPSCSKQHAVIQYRLVEYEKADGTMGKRVRPYIIDLESANGTFLNNNKIEGKRYYELQEKDMLKFGFSSREYVVLHEKTSTAEVEDEGEV